MSRRLNIEDLLYRRNIANHRPTGPSMSQAELEKQKERFFAAGGKIQQIPTGVSGEVYRTVWAKTLKAG